MAVSLAISITQNSQNITKNTSNVTVKLTASWTYGSYNQAKKSGWVKIDGTTYEFTSSFNYNATTNGSQVIYTTSVDVPHNSDGTKTLSCSASYTTGVSSGTITASASKKLTTIPRKSTLSVVNGTLDTAQTLTVTRQSNSFTHTIVASCGSDSTTICTKSTSTSVSFTPPISWANQNLTGTSVSVTYKITTYNGDTNIGSNTYTKTCSIPSSVKPSVSISISDPTGYSSTYGAAIKGKSTLQIVLSTTLGGGSPINTYLITANGESYTTASVVTSALKTSGTMIIDATVTDKRGRTDKATTSIQVLDYIAPIITSLSVRRCNQDGTENDQGVYIKVIFSGSVTSLNNSNSAKWAIETKKTSESSYTSYPIISLNNSYSVTNYTYIFAADTGSSYDVRIHVTDNFEELYRTTAASTALTIMHYKSNGKGMAVGKISELDNVFDIGFKTRFFAGIQPIFLTNDNGTNLDDITKSGFYASAVIQTSYLNCPFDSKNISFFMEVYDGGKSGQLCQKLTTTSGTNCCVYQRFYYNPGNGSKWYPWVKIYQQTPIVLWEGEETLGNDSDGNTNYIELSETIAEQINGIVLTFKFTDTIVHYQNFFVSKNFMADKFYTFEMTSYTFRSKAMKLLKFVDNVINSDGETVTKITGDLNNTTAGTGNSGVKYDNSKMSLVKVLGW